MLIWSLTKSSIPASKSCSNKSKVLIFPEIPAVRPGLVWTWTLPLATVSLISGNLFALFYPSKFNWFSFTMTVCQIDKIFCRNKWKEGEILLSGKYKLGVTSHALLLAGPWPGNIQDNGQHPGAIVTKLASLPHKLFWPRKMHERI